MILSTAWQGGLRYAGLVLAMMPLTGWAVDLAQPPQTGIEWLASMRKAASTLDYQGVVAYIKDQQVDSFRLFHQVREGQERERLVSINSPLREVVRTDGNIVRYSAATQQVVVETKPANRSVLLSFPDDPTVLNHYYHINLRGQEYVAGSLAQVVTLEPRDAHRYTRLLWIDTVTHLPLKLDVLNEEGQSVEQMLFTTINTQAEISSKDLEPSSRATSGISHISHRESRPVGELQWTLKKVPEGFQIISYSLFKKPPAVTPVEHILLSDGFSSVSVYIEKNGGLVKTGAYRMGSTNVVITMLGKHSITVMGEVPQKTVEVIADGLEQKPSGR